MSRRALARPITVKDMASLTILDRQGFVPVETASRGRGRYRFSRLVSLGLLASSGDALFPGCQPQTYTLTSDSEHMTDFHKIGTAVLANGDRVHVLAGRYPQGGQAAIVLRDAATGAPYATLSTNLAGHGAVITPDAFAVKSWSENAPLIEPLRACGLFGTPDSASPAALLRLPSGRSRIQPMSRRRASTASCVIAAGDKIVAKVTAI